MKSVLKHGVRGANGGKREGAGRPPDEFKKKCQELANSPKMLAWLKSVIEGNVIVDAEIRLKAWDRACDRGYGKPSQMLLNDPENPIGSAIFIVPQKDIGHKGGIS